MRAARILIIDGGPAAAQEALVKRGGRRHGANYAASLASQMPAGAPEPEFFILAAADGEALPQGMKLAGFDGIAWTGSPLSAYAGTPQVTGQIDLARDAYESGAPCFGSCWGLQIMCAALGGTVRLNPNGYEVGVARAVTLNEEGRAHPMFEGKPPVFDAFATHYDEVSELPANARLLAGNGMSRVQAVEIADGDKRFWGVQYHPEYDLRQIASILRRRAGAMAKDGGFGTAGEIEAMASALMQLDADPSRRDIAWRYGLGAGVLDATLHRREFANWLRVMVLPRAGLKAAAG
jgi:GMP synthase (glutamine-hydrolysing)